MNTFVIGKQGVSKGLSVNKKKGEILYLRLEQSKGGPEDVFLDRKNMPDIKGDKVVGEVSIYRSKVNNHWLLGKRKGGNSAVIIVQNARDVRTYPFPLEKIPAGGKCGDFLIEVSIGTRITVVAKDGNQTTFEYTTEEDLVDMSEQHMKRACRRIE